VSSKEKYITLPIISANDSKTVEEHLDLVMLTNGWRRFDWAKIKALAPPKITYPPKQNT
jgi:hypothetical protein